MGFRKVVGDTYLLLPFQDTLKACYLHSIPSIFLFFFDFDLMRSGLSLLNSIDSINNFW